MKKNLYSDIKNSLKLHIGRNNNYTEYKYYMYSKGDFDEKVEKESFKADFVESIIPVIFHKSDFEDIDKMYNSTQRYRRFEFDFCFSKCYTEKHNSNWYKTCTKRS